MSRCGGSVALSAGSPAFGEPKSKSVRVEFARHPSTPFPPKEGGTALRMTNPAKFYHVIFMIMHGEVAPIELKVTMILRIAN